jgi:hypothetical protein
MRIGQGLIEMMIALVVLTTGLAAALALATSNISAGRESELRLKASNLAREGVEIVRNIRDSNRLSNSTAPLDAFLEGGGAGGTIRRAVPVFNESTNTWSLDFNSTLSLNNVNTLVYRNGLLYVQPNGATPTPFHRLLTLNEICQDGSIKGNGSSCDSASPSGEKIGIQVISEVQWGVSGGERFTRLEDRIYKW